MKTERIIEELKQAAGRLGFEVRTEKGNFRGGRCTVGNEEIIMLNKRHLPEAQLVVLADSLRDLPVDEIFLKPAVRDALEEAWKQSDALEAEGVDESD
ncbi:MAG: hypothetical protein WD021_02430 [Rhodothermales bacterium]